MSGISCAARIPTLIRTWSGTLQRTTSRPCRLLSNELSGRRIRRDVDAFVSPNLRILRDFPDICGNRRRNWRTLVQLSGIAKIASPNFDHPLQFIVGLLPETYLL